MVKDEVNISEKLFILVINMYRHTNQTNMGRLLWMKYTPNHCEKLHVHFIDFYWV